MAIKQVVLSDISGTELADDSHARVHVKHPDNASTLELDVSVEEAGKLVNTNLRLVEFTIYEPNKPPRTAIVETKVLDKLFSGVNFDEVLAGARKLILETPVRRARAATAPKAPTGDKVDYTSPEHAGKLHRGRITEAEAEWVKANKDAASFNRMAQTGKHIDWNDPAEAKRYSL